jgi:5-methylcytosine-specific restriction endonuclease McrA
MANIVCSFDRLSNADLLSEIKRLARRECDATATLIASLMELDARQLYLEEGCSSLFTYCTAVLHLSEHAAYGRIKAARTAQAFPMVLDLLVGGEINLTTVTLLAPHLTVENHAIVLAEARHKSKRQVEELAARVAPRPAMPATIRKLPEPKPAGVSPAVAREGTAIATGPAQVAAPSPKPAEVTPLSPERYKVQFTVSKETHDKLRRVQDLLRHTVPNGDPAVIVDKAVSLLLTELERTKVAATDRPRTPRSTAAGSRHIPAAVKRTVWKRDRARCAFVGTSGRCTETGFLEFHHLLPFAEGGATSADNVELRCRPHNLYEAEAWFGPRGPTPVGEHGIELGLPFSTRFGPS